MVLSTGNSWGTFAIYLSLALPFAFNETGNQVTVFVTACFAAIAIGDGFGVHCSQIKNTTILSSMGAASDQIDYVKTQHPYALSVAMISSMCYLIIGTIST